jgi:hypothetical protein
MQYDRQTRLQYAPASNGSQFSPPPGGKAISQFSPQGRALSTSKPMVTYPGYVANTPYSPGAIIKGHPTTPSALAQKRARTEALRATLSPPPEVWTSGPVNTSRLAFKTTSQLRDELAPTGVKLPARGARIAGKRSSKFTDDLINNHDNRPLVKDNGFTSSGNSRMYSQNCMRTHSERNKAGLNPQPWRSMKSGPYSLTHRG